MTKKQIKNQITKLKPPIYGKKTLRLGIEFGLVLSEVANKKKVEITSEITQKAEDIFINEIKINGFEKTALNFVPLILATLEV
jgi:hypothetical protein